MRQGDGVALVQSEDVLHVVNAGLSPVRPKGGTQCAQGKSVPTGRFVREFDALAHRGVDYGMVSDDISSADCVHANFVLSALSDNAETSVASVVLIG